MDIVHWPIHPEAPFQFTSTDHYTLHPKEKHNRKSLKQLLAQINPTAIVCSGWMDSDYNALAKSYQKHIPVVLTLDNWWTGSLKQRLAALTAPWFIHRRFNRAWVPGEPQIPFAQKLGFSGHPSPQDSIAPTPSLSGHLQEAQNDIAFQENPLHRAISRCQGRSRTVGGFHGTL